MSQASLWQIQQQTPEYAELCHALYEREISALAQIESNSVVSLQHRLKSLPYYINRTADLMTRVQSPLELDIQNATWSTKQAKKMPLAGQTPEQVWQWYQSFNFSTGLVVPVALSDHIVLESIDRIDTDNQRFRGNRYGWFDQARVASPAADDVQLLKPTKRAMMAACAGHCWTPSVLLSKPTTNTALSQSQGDKVNKLQPVLPSLRELLLSCAINWQNFRKPLNFISS